MNPELVIALTARMRRAALVLLPAGVLIGSGAILALYFGFVAVKEAASLLALSGVLIISGIVLFAVRLLLAARRNH